MRYAAIDLGTVTSRLLVAEVGDKGVAPLDRQTTITNMGAGVDATRRIGTEGIERVAAAVSGYVARARELGATSLRAVATSAMRDAANRDEVCAALQAAGAPVEVISGEEEARLSYRGTLSGFDCLLIPPQAQILTVDIGGGSTELTLGDLQGPQRSQSLQMGARRVSERFLARHDPPLAAEVAEAREYIERGVATFFSAGECEPYLMIAVAGTATSTVSVRDKMQVYDSRLVHGVRVGAAELDEIYSMLASRTCAERAQVTGLEPGRAPIILGGLLVLQAVLKASGLGGYTVSESDILEGIVLSMAARAARE
jgi:exopolyphosphatase/guanosine-5'-triphosphate,3'-diphosphate pyrophosphatase